MRRLTASPSPGTPWTPHPLDALDGCGLAAGDRSIHVWLLRAGRNDPRLRQLVGHYAGVAPDSIETRIGPHGKPYLHDHSLRFNVSHSGDWSILALARDVEIGVDLEHARRVKRRTALIERCFTPAERERLVTAGDRGLLRYWAAKEALVKAIGRGIAYGLKQIEIGERNDGQIVIHSLSGPAAPAQRWRLVGLDPGGDGFAALAYEGVERPLALFRAPD